MKRFTAARGRLILLIALPLAALWWFAPRLTGWAIDAGLERYELPRFRFEVDRVSPRTLQLSEIRLDSGELTAERLVAEWSLDSLRSGRVERVRIDALQLAGRMENGEASFGELGHWPDDTEAGTGDPSLPLRALELRDARAVLETSAGTQEIAGDVDLRVEPHLEGSFEGSWQGTRERVGRLSLELGADGTLRVDARLDADAETLAAFWDSPPLGGGSVMVEGEGRFAEAPTLAAPLPALTRGSWRLAATARDLRIGDETHPQASLRGTAGVEGDVLRFETSQAEVVRAEGEPWQAALSLEGRLDGEGAELAAFSVALPAEPLLGRAGLLSASGRGRVAPDAANARLQLDAELEPDADRAGLRLRGPAEVAWRPDALDVALPECLELAIATGSLGESLRATRAGTLCLRTREAPIRLALPLQDPAHATARVKLTSPDLALASGSGGTRVRGRDLDLALDIDSDDAGVRGRLVLLGKQLALPDAELRVGELAVEGPFTLGDGDGDGDGGFDGQVRIGDLADARRDARFPALSGAGPVRIDAESVRFDLQAREATGSVRGRVHGAHRFASGKGHADVATRPLRFGEATRTQEVLLRWTGESLQFDDGQASVEARVDWDASGARTRVALDLGDLGITAPGVTVQDARGEIRLADAVRLETDGEQELRLGSVDAGLPFGAGYLRYAIGPNRVLELRECHLELAGGRLEISGELDLQGGPRQRLDFRAVGVELPRLLALAPVAGLRASGSLSGEMQLTVEEGRPVLRGGVFRSMQGGRIQYRPDEGAPAPPSVGDPAGMVRDMMRDFHYEVLDVAVTGWLDEQAFAQAKIRGHNPSFQDGHPVHLTINLSTAFGEAVAAIPELRALFERLAAAPGSDPQSGQRRP